MNRKITAFALGSGRCGGRGASGLTWAERTFSWCSIAARASEPKPQNVSRRNSRRVCGIRRCTAAASVQVQERVQAEHRQAELARRVRLQEPRTQFPLARVGRPASDQTERQLHLRARL